MRQHHLHQAKPAQLTKNEIKMRHQSPVKGAKYKTVELDGGVKLVVMTLPK